MNSRRRPSGFRLRSAIVVIACAGSAIAAQPATADVGVLDVKPGRAQPGDGVTLEIACGGCPAGGLRLPVSLVPTEHLPRPDLCGNSALCTPTAAAPPREPPFRYLGRTDRGSVLRFDVPEVRAGTYGFVVYCASCARGPDGSLIAGDARHQVLRVSDRGAPTLGSLLLAWLAALLR